MGQRFVIILVVVGLILAQSKTSGADLMSTQTLLVEKTAQQPALNLLSNTNILWDSESKETNIIAGETNAHFNFCFTNVSPTNILIISVHPSCGCTTAQLPQLPWLVPSGSNGQIGISVNLAGKSGTLQKTVTVGTDKGTKNLLVKIILPEALYAVSVYDSTLSETNRQTNQQIAKVDRQAIFRDECASCHVKPAEGKYGRELFIAACGICHETPHRASMVPNLHQLKEPTSFEFWQAMISQGKSGTLMPAFAKTAGGPLTDMQIVSVAVYLASAIPSQTNQPEKY
jgi:cytochrome c553